MEFRKEMPESIFTYYIATLYVGQINQTRIEIISKSPRYNNQYKQ